MSTPFENLMCQLEIVKFVARSCLYPQPKFGSAFAMWLFDWQTLIAGVLAVVATVGGGFLLWLQIGLQRTQMRQEEFRRGIAARIPLQNALFETSQYLHVCYEAWSNSSPESRPAQPIETMQIIMNAATNVDRETFKTINRLIVLFQVFEARVSTRSRVRPSNLLDTMIMDVAEMSFQANRLYSFARMEDGVDHVDYVKPKREDLQAVLYRDFDMKLLRKESEKMLRAERALDMRFGRSLPLQMTVR